MGAGNRCRFFGVQDPAGITAVKLLNSSGGIELDHLQFGEAATSVPEPGSTLAFIGCSILGVLGLRRGLLM